MHKERDDWGLGDLFNFEWGPKVFGFRMGAQRHRRRTQMFESGEVKFVILRLLKEKPRHGYEIIKALEERMAGCYTPSPGTVYPTLQMLEDQGYVRSSEASGKKVYEITPEGEKYLEEHRDLLDEIVDRVRDTVRDFTGGAIGELQGEFARLARGTFRNAWRRGPDDPAVRRVAEILKRAADE